MAHPVFGALLCIQLLQVWELLERPNPFRVVELGAGSGILAQDILDYAPSLSESLASALQYTCTDRCVACGFDNDIPRAERLITTGVPLRQFTGCIMSNELIDAFPVHIVEVRNGNLYEIYVTYQAGQFTEVVHRPSTPEIERRLSVLDIELAEGYRTEVNLAMDGWMRSVACALDRGFVLTIDYGYPAYEYYSPHRSRGTLACSHSHTPSGTPYSKIGRQDITAHVDFTSLAYAGEASGLRTIGLLSQRRMLLNLGLGRFLGMLRSVDLPPHRRISNRFGMAELVRTDGLGQFGVLVQSKGVSSQSLWGFEGGGYHVSSSLPLLTTRHLNLLAGGYPHLT
jgi:SAM-dependent MidA family methyltransferase